MRKDNTQNYQTPNTRIQHFSDFTSNIGSEKDELDKMRRQRQSNEPGAVDLANKTAMKFNKVTHKIDNLSKDEVNDQINAIEDDGVKTPSHKYKIIDDEVNPNHTFQNVTDVKESRIIKSFEAFATGFGFNNDIQGNTEFTQKNDMSDPIGDGENIEYQEPSEEEYSDQMPEDEYEDNYDDIYNNEYDNDENETSYMFFDNLETIHRQASELSELDHTMVNDKLNNGENWAEDHISSAKEVISQVYNFLSNEGIDEDLETNMENEEGDNYMFFSNLELICNMSEEMLELDRETLDDLMSGHDWAEDHISSAKENIQQVYEFLKSELN